MSIFPRTNASRQHQSAVKKHWPLIPEVVLVLALAWSCFDLAFRLDGFQETYWMIDLDVVAIVVLILGGGLLALFHHAQRADQKAAEYSRPGVFDSISPQFPVSDGGVELPKKDSQANRRTTSDPALSFDGGSFRALISSSE